MASLPSPTQVAGDQSGQFEAWYKKVDPSGSGAIQAGPAAGFLKKSGLNDNILSRIWDISDPGGKGYLDKSGFFVALKMVSLVQNGKEPSMANVNMTTPPPNMGEPPPHPPPPHPPPPHPPPPHPAPPAKPSAPQQAASGGVWTITPADRVRYDQIFNTLGPEANKLHGNKVRGVMLNSKLPMETLGKIWDLSDMDKDGSLDRVEFSIAMHLIYKVLENNAMPPSVPQEMLSSAQRAGVAQGPVPAPLAPPSQMPQPTTHKHQPNKDNSARGVDATLGTSAEKPQGPPPAPWVISAAEKARYDVMFHNADLDKDGYVSGQEIKGVFLQSGLPQMVLAHIWNLCDMKQTGKLTSEQFALAMWFIQQKLAGTDPPPALTPEMIPPTMRPKPAAESNVVPAKPQYSNPELQLVADEIEELNADKQKLESEIQQKETSIRLKNNEIKNLQTELDTLTSTLRQLEHQKGAAQQRLDDLAAQKKLLEGERNDLQAMIEAEQEEVSKLRTQVEEQEISLKAQEEEVMSKRQELTDLKNQENQLEESVASMKKRIDQLSLSQQDTQLHISQAHIKITELQEQERSMTEVLTSYDSAISSGDASSLSESSLRDVTPTFADPAYLHIGPSPTTSPKESPNEPTEPQQNGLVAQDATNNPKIKDTSFSGGHDPFAAAFGGQQNNVDVFGSWDKQSSAPPATSPIPPAADPFGGDAFASQAKGTNDPFGSEPFSSGGGGGGGGPPPRPESPTPALPPKKSKQPPPRPAPPKTRPAKPPPPQLNSNNNPTPTPTSNKTNANTTDPFTGGWGDNKTAPTTNNGGFADFANFADFDTKCSKVVSSNTASPWGEDGQNAPAPRHVSPDHTDPFASPFSAVRDSTRSTDNSPWPQDGFETSGFISEEGFGDNPGFGKEDPFSGSGKGADPFGGDYDPFKDQGYKDTEFSWEDEPDPFNTSNSTGVSSVSKPVENAEFCKADAFGFSIAGNEDEANANVFTGVSSKSNNKFSFDNQLDSNLKNRSKSVIGDPFVSQMRETIPTRSKTSLGQPRGMDVDFDPFSSSKVTPAEKNKWKSNEDLLNENFDTSWGSKIQQGPQDSASPFYDSFTTKPINKDMQQQTCLVSEDEQLVWAAQESIRMEEHRKQQEEQERVELELALTLSRSFTHSPTQPPHSSRSPSTGL